MPAASFSLRSDRRRAASFALAVAAHLLVVLLLLRLAPTPVERETEDRPLSTFTVAPPSPAPARTSQARTAARPVPKTASAAASPPKPAPAPPPPAVVPTEWPAMNIPGMFEAADIGRMRGRARADDGGADTASDSVAAYGPGAGPGGQTLYNARWYRKPSRAELAGYLTGGAPEKSWAVIACRTVADFRVENCRALGESPAGSGLARSLRQAAWQFRIRPPRVGGKTLVGGWVSICFDFNGSDVCDRAGDKADED